MSQILEDVVKDVAVELVGDLVKASARAGFSFIKNVFGEQETTEAPAPRRLAAAEEAAYVEDPFALPSSCAEDFVRCLQRGDHDRACGWCEPGLFADDERRAVLLETLSAAQPRRWRCRLYHHPVDWRTGDPLPWMGADYDVVFKVDTGARTMTLIVWMVAYGDGWAVSGLDWGPRRTD